MKKFLSINKILKIYKNFLLIRNCDEKIAQKYTEWKMRCPTHLSVGQEMVSACINEIFSNKDVAVSSHRAHAHYLGKGGNLNKMIAEIFGKVTGCSKGKGGSMHLIDPNCNFLGSTAIVGNTIPVGVGHAMNLRLNRKKNVSLIFFGDAGVETGVFFESINFAILKNLPAIFICENNFYSVYTPLKERQSQTKTISSRVGGLGIKTFRVNSYDWKTVIDILNFSRNYVLKNRKPIFLEFLTYRKYEHVGYLNDDHLKYRSMSEINFWKKKDPLKKIYLFLKNKKISERYLSNIEKKINLKIDKAFLYAEKSPFPKSKDFNLHVFKK